MAARAVGKFTKSIAFGTAISQNAFRLCLSTQFSNLKPTVGVLAQAISTNAAPRQRLWACSKGTQGEVTIHCLKDMLMDGNVQLFDVREPHEILERGKIPKSVNIPLNDLEAAFNLSPAEFREIYGVPKPSIKDENIVFHCQSGKRAGKAVEKARALGYTMANNFVGGWSEWEFDMQHCPKSVPRKVSVEH